MFLFQSCANQLPPSGGVDDRIPPKISAMSPRPNTTNFRGNSISFSFDEYVDRRSFEESFFISPRPEGEISFDWSGKEVEVEFSNNLERNRTYLIVIGNELKDQRGGNPLPSPVKFAFSTGSTIDKGKISGKVIAGNYDRVKVLAYIVNGKSENRLDPGSSPADYVIQTNSEGEYEFTNLPNGNYRLFAITDEDRNNLFDSQIEKISVPGKDYVLASGSSSISEVNFLLQDYEAAYDKNFLGKLKADSINFIYSNVNYNEKSIPPDYKFYFYFKNNTLSKSEIVNNFSLTEILTEKSFTPVFNWINDSLLEVFTTEKFASDSRMLITINLAATTKNYLYTMPFVTAGRTTLGKISGKVISDETISSPVFIKLFNKKNIFVRYSQELPPSLEFVFDDVLEGDYVLLAFVDENRNGRFDKGTSYPYRASEKYILYDDLSVKGAWNLDNVFLKF